VADLASASDYYPFGMQMPSRNITGSTAYRYGFNGKELDPNMDGNNYDYGFRIYNPQIGKFLSTDPLMKKYPELTPYQFASNSPISGIDLDGLEYYYAADGKYLGHRTKGADGKELSLDVTNDVRIVESVIKTKEYTLYNGVKDLHIKHKDFQEAVSIVKHEGDTKDENEYMGIAFQFYNNSKLHKKSLISTIRKESSVYNNPDVASVRYEPTDNSISVLASRKGVLSALSGGVDPTNGATQNDGNDFLSWGA
jgi:RHS repeat-associated protein